MFQRRKSRRRCCAPANVKSKEISPNRRAGCQATECKKEAIKIQAGELRFGTFVTIQVSEMTLYTSSFEVSTIFRSIRAGDGSIGEPRWPPSCFLGLIKGRGCVTPQQIVNLKESVEDDLQTYFDGYEDLDDHEKARVAKAVEEGHVADEDWKGVSPITPERDNFLSEWLKGRGSEPTRAERLSDTSLKEEGQGTGQS